MNLRPLNDRVVVQPLERETRTAGGIVLPDSAKEKPKQARVLAVGPGKRNEQGKREPVDVEVGQTVVYGSYAGSEIKVGSEDLLVLREEDILGVVEETGGKLKARGAKG